MDIVALSSLNEGTPITLIEAQSAGKPVVATDVGGVQDVVRHKESGLLSRSKDVFAFYSNMLKLVLTPSLRNFYGENGKRLVADKYNYMTLVNNIKNLYYSLLKEQNISIVSEAKEVSHPSYVEVN